MLSPNFSSHSEEEDGVFVIPTIFAKLNLDNEMLLTLKETIIPSSPPKENFVYRGVSRMDEKTPMLLSYMASKNNNNNNTTPVLEPIPEPVVYDEADDADTEWIETLTKIVIRNKANKKKRMWRSNIEEQKSVLDTTPSKQHRVTRRRKRNLPKRYKK